MEKILKVVKKNNLYIIRPIGEPTSLELKQFKVLKANMFPVH